ncbi:MAG: hypothetical protein SXG53_26350, partial [Pseudomonadota bacterium]|nr:hypothetical protein [Pseudomonadota bacterium]
QWLSSGLFQSQEELSRTIRVSTAQVSRLLKLARLPSVILNAFDSPTSLCETWGAELLSVWGDPEQQRHMAARARTIANDAARPQASVIYERLLEGTRKRRRNKERDDVVVDDRGKALFRVRYQRRGVSFIVPRERASQALVERVKLNLSLVLQAETLQAAENLRRNDSESS